MAKADDLLVLEEYEKTMADLQKQVDKLGKTLKKSADVQSRAWQKIRGSNQRAEDKLQDYDKKARQVGGTLERTSEKGSKAFGILGKAAQAVGSNILGVLTQMSGLIGAGGIGIPAAITSAFNLSQKFIRMNNQLQPLSDNFGSTTTAMGMAWTIADKTKTSYQKATEALSSLSSVGIDANTTNLELATSIADLSFVSGVGADNMAQLAAALKFEGDAENLAETMMEVQNAIMGTGFQATELTKVTSTTAELIKKFAGYSHDAGEGAVSLARGIAGAAGAMKDLGVSVETSTQFLDKVLDPENLKENVKLFSQLGMSYSEAANMIVGGDRETFIDKMMEKIPQLANRLSQIKDPLALQNYAKAIGLPLELVQKFQGRSAAEVKELIAEQRKTADAAEKKRQKAQADADKFEDLMNDVKMQVLGPLMQIARDLFTGKTMRTVATLMRQFSIVLSKILPPFIKVLNNAMGRLGVWVQKNEHIIVDLSTKVGGYIEKIINGLGPFLKKVGSFLSGGGGMGLAGIAGGALLGKKFLPNMISGFGNTLLGKIGLGNKDGSSKENALFVRDVNSEGGGAVGQLLKKGKGKGIFSRILGLAKSGGGKIAGMMSGIGGKIASKGKSFGAAARRGAKGLGGQAARIAKIGNLAGRTGSGIAGAAAGGSRLAGMAMGATKLAGPLLKVAGPLGAVASQVGNVMTLIESNDLKEQMKAGGGMLGALLGGALGTALGPIGTAAGAFVGEWVGNKLGGMLHDAGSYVGEQFDAAEKAIVKWGRGIDEEGARITDLTRERLAIQAQAANEEVKSLEDRKKMLIAAGRKAEAETVQGRIDAMKKKSKELAGAAKKQQFEISDTIGGIITSIGRAIGFDMSEETSVEIKRFIAKTVHELNFAWTNIQNTFIRGMDALFMMLLDRSLFKAVGLGQDIVKRIESGRKVEEQIEATFQKSGRPAVIAAKAQAILDNNRESLSARRVNLLQRQITKLREGDKIDEKYNEQLKTIKEQAELQKKQLAATRQVGGYARATAENTKKETKRSSRISLIENFMKRSEIYSIQTYG